MCLTTGINLSDLFTTGFPSRITPYLHTRLEGVVLTIGLCGGVIVVVVRVVCCMLHVVCSCVLCKSTCCRFNVLFVIHVYF